MILENGSVKITPLYPHFLIMMTLTFSSEKMSFSSFLTSFNAIISFNKPDELTFLWLENIPFRGFWFCDLLLGGFRGNWAFHGSRSLNNIAF